MRVKLILPGVAEANERHLRPIKYSLFPPLGLATLAGYLDSTDEVALQDEHVESLDVADQPDLVGIEVYITSARRAYAIADGYRRRGVHVVLGGVHVTACPDEALAHADTIVVGPAEEAWPRFLADLRRGCAQRVYQSTCRDLTTLPPIRRDLIKRHNYLVPNSIVVSRGCPHSCDFCYGPSFFRGGKRFYTCGVDQALSEIERLPGRHLFFLDDNILGDPDFAAALFSGMRGMGRVWQGAATVQSVLNTELLNRAATSGLKSLFVGFESLNQNDMRRHGKSHNRTVEYAAAVAALHERDIMINASFVFGFDDDDPSVFDATVDWAVEQGIETATFHILTPYPGTRLFDHYAEAGRILHNDWDLYDTRHAVCQHPRMTAAEIEAGYWRAYKRFYGWRSIVRAAAAKSSLWDVLRHIAYVGAWKKCDPLWGLVIKVKRLDLAVSPLERVLTGQANPALPTGAHGWPIHRHTSFFHPDTRS